MVAQQVVGRDAKKNILNKAKLNEFSTILESKNFS